MAFHGLFWSFLDLFGTLAQFICQHQNFGKGSTFLSYDKQLFAWIRNFTIHFTVTLMKMWTDSKQFSLSIFFDKGNCLIPAMLCIFRRLAFYTGLLGTHPQIFQLQRASWLYFFVKSKPIFVKPFYRI